MVQVTESCVISCFKLHRARHLLWNDELRDIGAESNPDVFPRSLC